MGPPATLDPHKPIPPSLCQGTLSPTTVRAVQKKFSSAEAWHIFNDIFGDLLKQVCFKKQQEAGLKNVHYLATSGPESQGRPVGTETGQLCAGPWSAPGSETASGLC